MDSKWTISGDDIEYVIITENKDVILTSKDYSVVKHIVEMHNNHIENKDVVFKFEIDTEQHKKFLKFKKKLKKQYFGAVGGGEQFIFIPTGIGTLVKAKYGEDEIDLTNYYEF